MRHSIRDQSSGFVAHAFPFQIDVHSVLNSKELVLSLSRKLKAGVAGAALAVALMGVSASAASAAPALWAHSGGVKFVGTLTLSGAGQTGTVCTFAPSFAGFAASNMGGTQAGVFEAGTSSDALCGPSNYALKLGMNARGEKSGTARSLTNVGNTVPGRYPTTPVGTAGSPFSAASWTVPFVNGSGSTPSRITFANTHLGGGLYGTGTLNVTGTSGGLVTLN